MDAFTKELLKNLGEAEALGCRIGKLRAAAGQYGGAEAVRHDLRRGFECFDRLAELGRLELTPEALAVQAKYGALFTDDEVNCCFARLCAAGYYGGLA